MDLINEKLIEINANYSNKDEVLNAVADLLINEDRLVDKKTYLKLA